MMLAGIALLAAAVLPGLGNSRASNDRLVCFSNLRQIGQAFSLWSAEHDNLFPWNLYPADGGTRGSLYVNNPFVHFGLLSNFLASARSLACPSDGLVRPAEDFSARPDVGFWHPNQRNNAVSYFVGLHALTDDARSLVSGDRHLGGLLGPVDCSLANPIDCLMLSWRSGPPLRWDSGLHGAEGNFLSLDGRVELVPTSGLWGAVSNANTRYANIHVLLPR